MMAYPTEDQKGKYIGVFWAIFNLGGVVGASVALGQNFNSKVRLIVFPLFRPKMIYDFELQANSGKPSFSNYRTSVRVY